MGSLNRHVANDRIARVYDTLVGAQANEKGVKAHVKAIRGSVALPGAQVAEGLQEFIQQAKKAKGGKRG